MLFIDEIHRFSKTQQDSLLAAVEARHVTLVAATTENPFFSIVSPLLSPQPAADPAAAGRRRRSAQLVDRALTSERGLDGAVDARRRRPRRTCCAWPSGDARRALTALEAAAGTVAGRGPDRRSTSRRSSRPSTRAAVRYDRDGDQHYDVISAFIKSIRGSDADAAVHYLARMLEAGEDPRFIARRLVVHASEDVGLADPTALLAASAAAQAVQLIGLPEARINLAQATIHLALAPKSNAVVRAIDAAQADVRAGLAGAVPPALRDAHYPGAKKLGAGARYVYPPDTPDGVVRPAVPARRAGRPRLLRAGRSRGRAGGGRAAGPAARDRAGVRARRAVTR